MAGITIHRWVAYPVFTQAQRSNEYVIAVPDLGSYPMAALI